MEEDVKWVIADEERTRHDALFYSQKPRDGFLSGEQARALFIRSKLPLPDLSKIWKLADITRDNMLDAAEFAIAVHLIQSRLRGLEIPSSLPQTLILQHLPFVKVPVMTQAEWEAYQSTFSWKDKHHTGYIDTQTSCSVLSQSQLPSDVLSKIWDLSDLDGDLQLSSTEFAIALHLVRFCKRGNRVDGSVDVMALLPGKISTEDPDEKRQRLAEVQMSKRSLLSAKEKFCHEIAGALDDENIAERIRPELDKIEVQLQALEKEESELRKDLRLIKDKTKKGSFKPFDRSFLLKRRRCGRDLFQDKALSITQVDDDELKELFTANEPLIEIQHPSSNNLDKRLEPTPTEVGDEVVESSPLNTEPVVSKDNYITGDNQESVTLNGEQNEGRKEEEKTGASSPVETETGTELEALELEESAIEMQAGIVRTVDFNQNDSKKQVHQEFKINYSHSSATSGKTKDSNPLKPVATSNEKQASLANGDGASFNGLVNEHVDCQQAAPRVLCANVDEIFKQLNNHDKQDNDVEKTKSVGEPREDVQELNYCSVNAVFGGRDCSSQDGESVSEEMQSVTALTTESSVGKPDEMFKISKSDDAKVVETRSEEVQPNEDVSSGESEQFANSVMQKDETRVNSELEGQSLKHPTPKGLVPRPISVLEDKKRDEEERLRKRRIEEELIRKARRDALEREEEQKRANLERKAHFEKERQRLFHQMSLAEQENEVKKAPLSKTEAGKAIEKELQQQRAREQQMREEKERIKELERREIEKTKPKTQQLRRQSSTEKPNNEEQNPFVIENKNTGDVIRRTQKTTEKRTLGEKRKSFIELEIERQKAAEEELKRETERRKLERLHNQPSALQSEDIVVRSSSHISEAPPRDTSYGRDTIDSGVRVEDNPNQKTGKDKTYVVTEDKERQREKEQQDKIRRECQMREAAELVRQKTIREEEQRRRKEVELAEAAKRRQEEEERVMKSIEEAKSRRASFQVQKKFLEDRMKKELEENEVQQPSRLRRSSSSSSTTSSDRGDTLDESKKFIIIPARGESEDRPEPLMTSVKDRMASFQRNQSDNDLLKKRHPSASCDENVDSSGKPQEVTMRNKAPKRDSKQNRVSFYAENLRAQEIQARVDRDTEVRPRTDEDLYTRRALSFGDVVGRRKQFEQNQFRSQPAAPVRARCSPPTSPRDEEDAGGIPAFKDERIRKELEDQKKKEVTYRKKSELTSGKAAGSTSSDKIDNIRRNPLPNKIQVTVQFETEGNGQNEIVSHMDRSEVTKPDAKPNANQRPSPQSIATSEQPRKKAGKSLLELEREEERRREEELAHAREEARRAMLTKEQQLQEEKRRKEDEEAELARKAQEEKEKRKRRTSAMAAMWEKMSQQ